MKWIAAAGAFVVSLDSMVNIGLPAMAATFGAPPERVRWIIICYVGTYAVTSFVGGAAADRLGHLAVFRAGAVLSAAGFTVCATAPSFGALLAGRALQGLGGGLVYGTAPALATLGAGGPARARRVGFLNAAIGLGFAAGPLAAGVLVDVFGWRAVFHARVPLALGLFAWALAVRAVGAGASPRLVAARDVLRGAVLGPGAASFVANASIFAIWLLLPFYLVSARGLSATVGGALFMLTPLGLAAAAPLAGRLGARVAQRGLMTAGLALEAAALAALSRADTATPLGALALALFGAGFGLGLFQVPNMTAVLAAFPAGQQGAAGGFTFLARTLGVVTGVMVLAEVFAARRAQAGFQPAYAEAFVLAAAAVGAAAVAVLAGGRRRRP
ncbi:MAG: MFS transporter [Candidatus Rokubacteria bacterium]|nr:MFS transporter [Candidatus Rokubacteria bacterium]